MLTKIGCQMITGPQIRGARGLLDWSADVLAQKTGLSVDTIRNIEKGRVQGHSSSIDKIVQIFAAYDIEFIPDDGVKRRSENVVTLEGFENFKFFIDQVYEAATKPSARDGTKPICVCNVDNDIFRKHLKDYYFVHLARMQKLEGVQIRILAPKLDVDQPPNVHYLKYRFLKEMKSTVAPFYVFANSFALIDFSAPNPPRVLMVNSAVLADSFRDQFEIMWNNASDKPQKIK